MIAAKKMTAFSRSRLFSEKELLSRTRARARTHTCMSYSVGLVVVVSHEGVERSQLHPAHTQLLRGVPPKPTHVGTCQGHSKQAKQQHR